jgi:hypothetical protein
VVGRGSTAPAPGRGEPEPLASHLQDAVGPPADSALARAAGAPEHLAVARDGSRPRRFRALPFCVLLCAVVRRRSPSPLYVRWPAAYNENASSSALLGRVLDLVSSSGSDHRGKWCPRARPRAEARSRGPATDRTDGSTIARRSVPDAGPLFGIQIHVTGHSRTQADWTGRRRRATTNSGGESEDVTGRQAERCPSQWRPGPPERRRRHETDERGA